MHGKQSWQSVRPPGCARRPRALESEHDFASFSRPHRAGGPTVRRLDRLAVARAVDRLEVSARGNAFLQQMVRSLLGTLVAVGAGQIVPDAMARVLCGHHSATAVIAMVHLCCGWITVHPPRER